MLWGTEEHVRELFGDGVSDLRLERRTSVQRFKSIDHYLDFFRTYFGPMMRAFERVGADGEAALEADLREQLERYNRGGDRAFVLESEYLQVIATRATTGARPQDADRGADHQDAEEDEAGDAAALTEHA